MKRQSDPATLWREIENAGGIDAYVEERLTRHGYIVEPRDTVNMSKRELSEYKQRLKAAAEEKKRLKKAAWQARKQHHIVHLGEGIYWNDADTRDKFDLPNGTERAAENELPPLETPARLAGALGLTVAELRWLTYHRDAATCVHYYRFEIPKRDGTSRPIWAPMPKLKQAQRWILARIVEKLPVHSAAHGFVPLRSTATNACIHTDSRVLIKLDLHNFFPTVTFPRVKGVFRKAGYGEQVAILLAALCTEAPREVVRHLGETYYIAMGPRCLPQGAPTSPAITNTLCLSMDRRISALAKKNGWRYTRYADDLTLSMSKSAKHPPRTGKIVGLVKRIVSEEGFQINAAKTRLARATRRQTVTGLVVNDDQGPRVTRRLKRRIRAAVHNLVCGRELAAGDTPQKLAGYAAYIHMTDPVLGRKLLAALKPYLTIEREVMKAASF